MKSLYNKDKLNQTNLIEKHTIILFIYIWLDKVQKYSQQV